MRNKLLITFLFLFAAMFLFNCGAGTTITDNPTGDIFSNAAEEDAPDAASTGGDDSVESDAMYETVTGSVLSYACGVFEDCYTGFDEVACQTYLNTNFAMLGVFGVDTTTYASFDAVQDAIEDEELVVSSSAVSACLSAITDISCSDISEKNAYSESLPSDYSRVYLIIPEEC